MIQLILLVCFVTACLYVFAEMTFERSFPRHFLKYVLLFAALLGFAVFSEAQGIRYSSNVTTSSTNVPAGAQAPVYTYPYAKITVCGYPTTPSGAVCTNTVTTYSDIGLTTANPSPISSDSQGKFGFWMASGTYAYSIATPTGTYLGTYPISIGGSGSGSGIVQSVSVATANGLQGTSSGGANPVITLSPDSTHIIPTAGGSASLYLNQLGTYTTPSPGLTSFQGRTTSAAVLNTADVGGLGTISNSTTGNAATSTALDHTPTLCGAGFSPKGIDASGNPVTCQAIGGSNGFPFTLGTTPIGASSSTTGINGLSVNGVILNSGGSPTQYLDGTGNYSTPSAGGITSINTDTTAAQLIRGGDGVGVVTASGTTMISLVPAFAITGFSCSTCGTYETGATIASPTNFTASYTSTPTSASISDGTNSTTLTTPFTSGSLAFAYSVNTTFILTAVGATTKTATQAIMFTKCTFSGIGGTGGTGATASGSGDCTSGETATITAASVTTVLGSNGLGNTAAGQTFSLSPSGQYIVLLLSGGCGHTLTVNTFTTAFTTLALTYTNLLGGSQGGMCLYTSPSTLSGTYNVVVSAL